MKIKRLFFVVLIFNFTLLSAREYHVSVKGNDSNEGSSQKPFKTINRAVQSAFPGDTITVHAGIYREWVNPVRGGESDSKRIVYRAAPGEKAEIKGSEVVTGWKKVKDNVWKVVVPNSLFGNYNPYQDSVFGDWFNRMGRIHHTGEVFLNGKSLYEKENLEKVFKSVPDNKIKDPEGSTYTWYCESDQNNTTIWADFHNFNPNKEITEISARRTCFYPDKPGINYLTISSFYISQAATQWAAPTAEQIGMISTNWNKGWIIENNVICDSKCSGITLGKERGTGHNVWSADKDNVYNDGNIHYIEVTFRVLRNGWNKEHIGSHIVRNNTIFNCEQTGICGSMGAVFSLIENNHIYNIWTKRQFNGAEIAGIKFHAAIDAVVKKNRINDCGRGMWFDWMTQGTRISSNLFYNNDLEDLFLEVDHGPFIVDNNIMLSHSSISTMSEGGAYAHNLIAGEVVMWPEPNRFTPYFLPHSTDIAGLTTILGGDDRYFNNIFIGSGAESQPGKKSKYGTGIYNDAKYPVFMGGNIYYQGAVPCIKEGKTVNSSSFNPNLMLEEKETGVYLKISLDESYYSFRGQLVTSDLLNKTRVTKSVFDNPDGTSLILDKDYFGHTRSGGNAYAGPFVDLEKGELNLKVW